jgi:hypothetical protein
VTPRAFAADDFVVFLLFMRVKGNSGHHPNAG